MVTTMRFPTSSIILPEANPRPRAEVIRDLEETRREILELAARWAGLRVAGLSLHDARAVIEAEIERLRAIRNARESGL
jgi:hypothetical protein